MDEVLSTAYPQYYVNVDNLSTPPVDTFLLLKKIANFPAVPEHKFIFGSKYRYNICKFLFSYSQISHYINLFLSQNTACFVDSVENLSTGDVDKLELCRNDIACYIASDRKCG